MNASEYTFDHTDFSITNFEVGRWIGYPEKGVPPAIEEQIGAVLSELMDLVEIKAGFRIYDNVAVDSALIRIENAEFHTKKIIARAIRKASSMAIFTCTIGEAVSSWSTQLIKNNPLKGYLADISASIMAEKTAERIQEEIEKYAREQASSISNRYSPGYCGWSVSDQHLLFSLLPENFCGITLNENALMHPIKSVSGIIAIGKEIVKNPYQCNICDITDCIMSPKT
jgi:uncharacterized protein YlaI